MTQASLVAPRDRNAQTAKGSRAIGELVQHTRYGPLVVPGEGDMISAFLKAMGEWAYLETEFVCSIIPPGLRVLDGGAFVGTFALSLARRTPARMVSVEVNPTVVPLLQANFVRLAPDSYVVEHAAIGESTTLAYTLNSAAENLGATRVVASGAKADTNHFDEASPRHATTLAELRKRHGDFDLIKLDIEGGELAALTADTCWLQAFRPLLWLECNESASAFPMYDFLHSIGYDVYFYAYPSHNAANHLGCTKPIFPGAYEAGLLAVGAGSPELRLSDSLRQAGCDLVKLASREHLKACLWVTPRWAFSDWDDMPRSRLLALCGRFYRGESYNTFLSEECPPATES